MEQPFRQGNGRGTLIYFKQLVEIMAGKDNSKVVILNITNMFTILVLFVPTYLINSSEQGF